MDMKDNPLGAILNQLQGVHQEILKVKEEVGKKTVVGSAGGGMVKVTANGRQEVVQVAIEAEVVDPGDVEMLEDLVQAAVNQAMTKAREMWNEAVGKFGGGLDIPGLGKLTDL